MAIVVMGVGGCGKTTFGRHLADAIGGEFLDGDDFHSPASIRKMRSGIPLNDLDRAPWLRTLNTAVLERSDATVMACSALKRVYRDTLRSGASVVFLHLKVTEELAQERLSGRGDHFFPASLIRSQFDTLQPLAPEENGLALDGSANLDDLVLQARDYLEQHADAWSEDRTSQASSSPAERSRR